MPLTRIPAGGVVTATTFTFNSLNVTATTVTASTITGALVISGGMAVGGSAYIGGNLTVLGTINATITGIASSATNIVGGTTGQVPYQSAAGTTSFFGPGTAGQILLSNGASAPVYTNTAGIYVGAATSAVNLFGGTAGQLHYQSAPGTTTFLSTGTTGQLLVSAAGAPVWTNTSSLYVQDSNVSTNLRAGAAGQIHYQTGANASGFITTATTGNFLQANFASAPTWTTTGSMYVGNSVVSTNLRAGTAGQLHYQTGADTSGFISTATTGNFLQANFAGAPTWTTTGSMYVSRAVFADSASGSAGSVANAVTFNNGGSGAASGTTFNGSVAQTISYNTLGAMPTTGGTFSGPVTFSQPVTFSGSATYVLSTNTFYTDNILEMHTPPAGVSAPWFVDDGKDIGFRFHYYANSTDTNAALVLDNASKELHWYSSGAESAAGDFSTGTYGIFRTGVIKVSNGAGNAGNTTTGDLQVLGGIGVGGGAFFGGIVTATTFVGALSFSHSAGTGLTGSAYNGSAAQTWSLNTATLMQTAVNLAGGSANQFAYQTGAGATAFISTGSMYVSRAVFADSASGSAGSVANALTTGTGLLFDSGTTFNGSAARTISLNTTTLMQVATQVVQSHTAGTGLTGSTYNGSTAQTWTVNTATLMQVSTQVVQSHSAGTGLTGSAFNGSTAQTWTLNTATLMANAVSAINLSAGSAMALPYQSASGTTAYLAAGTSGQILQTNGTGSAPTWVPISGLSAGTATTATQLNTQLSTANATYYPTFVDANNSSAAAEFFYTTSSFVINPASGAVSISGLTVNGVSSLNGRTTVKDTINADTSYPLGIQNGSQQPWWLRAITTSNKFALHLNGTGDLVTVDTSGNVGVGTTAPLAKLEVSSTASTTVKVTTSGGNTLFRGYEIGATTGDSGVYGSMKMEVNGGELRFTAGYATWGGYQTFYTNGVERLRLTGNGGIAIGGAANYGSSGQVLQSNGDAAPTWVNPTTLASASATNADNIRTIARTTNASHFLTFVDSNNAANAYELVYTTSTFAINPATGNIGLNVTPSAFKIDTLMSTTATGRVDHIQLGHSGQNTLGIQSFGQSHASSPAANQIAVYNAEQHLHLVTDSQANVNAGTSLLGIFLRSGGNVGIGTKSPGQVLEVNGRGLFTGATTASAGSIQVTSIDAAIRLKWTSSPVADKNTWDIRSVGTGATPYLQFRTINDANTVFTDRVAFTNDGNVGIGTASPLSRLDVTGSGTSVFQRIRTTDTGSTNVALRIQDGTTGSTDSDGIYFGRTGADATNYLWTYENEPWVFATNNAERLRITAAGGISFGGTSNFGSSGQILQSNGNAVPTWVSPSTLASASATNADNLRTVIQTASGTYYPSFVDSNNGTAAYEAHYTTSSFAINPASGLVTIAAPVGGDGLPSLRVTQGTAPSSFNWTASFMNSSLGSSRNNILMIGQAETNKNAGYIGFNHSGTAGSVNNFLTFGLHSVDNIMNITGNGFVGVGTTTPGAKVEIKDGDLWLNGAAGASNPEIRFIDDSGISVAGAKIRYGNNDGNLYFEHIYDQATSGFFFRNRTAGTTLNTLSLVNGFAGIGNTAPAYKLSVNTASDVWHAQFGTSGGKQFRIGGSTTAGSVIGAYNDDGNSSPATLLLQRDGGNVGINVSSATGRLHVGGAGNSTGGNIHLGDNTDAAAKWTYITAAHYNGATNATGVSLIGHYATSTDNIINLGGNIYEAHPATQIQFYTHTATTHATGGSLRLTITRNGGVAFGTSTSAFGSSGQILQSNGDAAPTWVSLSGLTAGTASSLLNFTAATSGNPLAADSPNTIDDIGYVASNISLYANGSAGTQTDGGLYVAGYSTSWYHQIFGDFRTGSISVRGKNSNTWQAWRSIPTIHVNDNAPSIYNVGDFWWESDTGRLKIYYHDGSSGQWVDAVPVINTSLFFSKAGGAISGPVSINGALDVTGNINATAEITAYYSDRRLKTDIVTIENALVKVKKLNGVTYRPNALAESYGLGTNSDVVGLFADEVEQVLPQAVKPAPFDIDENGNSKSGENYKTIQYEKVVPLLVEAIKEQQSIIEAQQAKIDRLMKHLGLED